MSNIKTISGEVGSGKTHKLCEEALKEGSTVVCANVERMERKLQGYEITGVPLISYQDFLDDVYNESLTGTYMLDDTEQFLDFLSGGSIIAATFNIGG